MPATDIILRRVRTVHGQHRQGTQHDQCDGRLCTTVRALWGIQNIGGRGGEDLLQLLKARWREGTSKRDSSVHLEHVSAVVTDLVEEARLQVENCGWGEDCAINL